MSCRKQGLSRCSINARPRAWIIFLPLSDACSAWKRSGRDDETRYTNPLSISTMLRDFLVLRWPRMLLVHCFNLVTNVLHVTTLRFLVHYLCLPGGFDSQAVWKRHVDLACSICACNLLCYMVSLCSLMWIRMCCSYLHNLGFVARLRYLCFWRVWFKSRRLFIDSYDFIFYVHLIFLLCVLGFLVCNHWVIYCT